MKNREDKNLDMLVENMMKDFSLESPSSDFTSKVMSEALAENKRKTISYKPVISKGAWFIISGCIGALITWIIINDPTQNGPPSNSHFNVFNFEKALSIFPRFQFSYLTINIIVIAMAMVFIQLILLKTHLNKKFHKTSSPQSKGD
ncbi:MAG TPA: hypothetical protein VIJ95_05760 [Hanamia sp.]